MSNKKEKVYDSLQNLSEQQSEERLLRKVVRKGHRDGDGGYLFRATFLL